MLNSVVQLVLGLVGVLVGIGFWFGKVEPRHAATAFTYKQNAVIFAIVGLLFVGVGLAHLV